MTDSKRNRFKALDPEKSGSSSEEVVVHLREMIHRGELQRGDRLPPERDLAKLLGVSRPTLRAGIRSLAAHGILQSRQGAGTFVVDNDGPPALDSSPLRLMAALDGVSRPRRCLRHGVRSRWRWPASLPSAQTGDDMASIAEELAGMYASLDEPEQYLSTICGSIRWWQRRPETEFLLR
jgi:GntR family transcriptional repressor for pyruvate dehydrogenase complex